MKNCFTRQSEKARYEVMKIEQTTKLCPKCGESYVGVSAMSRIPNVGNICPDCGSREALESIGIDKAEQDKIIGIIHNHTTN